MLWETGSTDNQCSVESMDSYALADEAAVHRQALRLIAIAEQSHHEAWTDNCEHSSSFAGSSGRYTSS